MPTVHFISGLPRSGSTLLAAILRQNPKCHASIATPLAPMLAEQIRAMSLPENNVLLTDAQRGAILSGIVAGYLSRYQERAVVFDTNRMWCSMMPLIEKLLPEARVICCLRSPAWIIDSVEQLVQRNPTYASNMFSGKTSEVQTVYSRYDALIKTGILGTSMKCLRQAWFGVQADKLIGIEYDSLVAKPAFVIDRLYSLLNIPYFAHDFNNVEYEESEFDRKVNMPGLHVARGKIEQRLRPTILPPEVFKQNDVEFWRLEGQNPNNVPIL